MLVDLFLGANIAVIYVIQKFSVQVIFIAVGNGFVSFHR